MKKTVSATDPESGLFHKGEHEKCFAYEVQTAYDRNKFIFDVTVVICRIQRKASKP